jgi:hypothetical protein
LFYEFSLETHVPTDHRLRSIDRFVELGEVRRMLAPGSRYEEVGPAFIGQQSAVVDSMQLACTQLLY